MPPKKNKRTDTSKIGLYQPHNIKLTNKVISIIARKVKAGNYPKIAARAAGVSKATYCRWKRHARQIQDDIDKVIGDIRDEEDIQATEEKLVAELNRYEQLCLKFMSKVVVADAQGEEQQVSRASRGKRPEAGKGGDWRAADAFLGKRYNRRWGTTTHLQVEEIGNETTEKRLQDIAAMSDEELAAMDTGGSNSNGNRVGGVGKDERATTPDSSPRPKPGQIPATLSES